MYPLIYHPMSIIDLDLVKRLVYPILSVSCELLCINWNKPQRGLITSW